MGGDDRFKGLYGWGEIISAPYKMSGWDTHGVDVKYTCKFPKPVTKSVIEKDKTLARLLLFRAPQATNFLLTDDEVRKLTKLLTGLGYTAPKAEVAS